MFKPFKTPLPKNHPQRPSQFKEDDTILESPPRRKTATSYVSSGVSTPKAFDVSLKTNKPELYSDNSEGYYLVLWRNFTTKKNKTWDGDGVLSIFGGFARLQDISGKLMGKVTFKDPLLPGSSLSIGGKDIEVDSIITKSDFEAGKPFIQSSSKRKPSSSDDNSLVPKRICTTLSLPKSNPKLDSQKEHNSGAEIPVKSFYSHQSNRNLITCTSFKSPLQKTKIKSRVRTPISAPRHDPNAPEAVLMKRPSEIPKGKEVMDVVLDPFLSQHLRKHQKEGVKFLYECVMGIRDFNGNGAILADEMGLGKSLTTIALLWTLLKQSPIQGCTRIIQKALIVCPATLIGNWKKEFTKWLGNERIGVFIMDGKRNKLTDFTHGKSYSVMVVGYEKLRSIQEELKKGIGIDIVIADEGHRLKTAQNKSAQAIRSLITPRKIILSGTPIQNDLSEFFEMVDFVNPGLLGTYKAFNKEFEAPIMKSRQPEASKKDIECGISRQEELSLLTQAFILRRTSEILSKYLPSRTEYVLFCRPSQAQVQVYQHVLASPSFGNILGSPEASLQLITLLKKVCNAPCLLANKNINSSTNPKVSELLDVIPTELLKLSPLKASAKIRVLDQLLNQLSQNTSEKIVIVSNYTSTLDLLSQHLTSKSLSYLRLDGKTPTSKRQDLVDIFNKTSASKNFAFLLSAKAGGAGINLIGASRLVLFDVDWNPATDLQAMARIHRDGQKKPVKIYRFLLSGGIDEKIYQRQTTKMGLAESVVDGKKNDASFSLQELRDLFRLDLNSKCQTHDLLDCDCKGRGTNTLSSSNFNDVPVDDDISVSSKEDDGNFVHPIINRIVPGTRANVDAIEQQLEDYLEKNLSKKSKKSIQALMLYQHFDSSLFQESVNNSEHSIESSISMQKNLGDDILANILKDQTNIAYIFSRKNGS
ncbi:DNA repair and recombination protein RAD54B [Erysiphe neolycopersici]|uniref:DNA repair and recombination protein RAD54B n=1 Tax=Erysiphe neolycopersici TaxID=212602 RepID=A0A420HKZ3_9PEZI|nr:DNA repair and recombination protein RAD54B [Erysiphe neolycopersici]